MLALFCGPPSPAASPLLLITWGRAQPGTQLVPFTLADPQGCHCVGRWPLKAPCVQYHTNKDSESSACVLAQTQPPRSYTRCTGTDSDAPGT